MKVLIVAKTRMHWGACVGGLALDTNRNVRLLTSNGSRQPTNTDYEVGQIWDLDFTPKPDARPPHVEDILVLHRELAGQEPHLRDFLCQRVQPWRGAPNQTFDGLVRPTFQGAGYVNDIMGVPHMSVGFWQSDRRLTREDEGDAVRYRYPRLPKSREVRLLKYVGFAPPVDVIPTGTLVRLSLARWWRQPDADLEERCYLQLSGWYL